MYLFIYIRIAKECGRSVCVIIVFVPLHATVDKLDKPRVAAASA